MQSMPLLNIGTLLKQERKFGHEEDSTHEDFNPTI
jgi:hypothetical protein